MIVYAGSTIGALTPALARGGLAPPTGDDWGSIPHICRTSPRPLRGTPLINAGGKMVRCTNKINDHLLRFICPLVFKVTGPDHRGFGIFDLPIGTLFLIFFHGVSLLFS